MCYNNVTRNNSQWKYTPCKPLFYNILAYTATSGLTMFFKIKAMWYHNSIKIVKLMGITRTTTIQLYIDDIHSIQMILNNSFDLSGMLGKTNKSSYNRPYAYIAYYHKPQNYLVKHIVCCEKQTEHFTTYISIQDLLFDFPIVVSVC